MLRKIILFGFLCFLGIHAKAIDSFFRTEEVEKNNFLTLSAEKLTFKNDANPFDSSGLEIDFGHHFKWPFEVNVSFFTALSAQQKVSVSGFSSGLSYDLIGTCCGANRTTYLGQEPIIIEKSRLSHLLQLGFGIDSYYFDGSKFVYSSSGLHLSMNYRFNFFGYNFKISGKQSQLKINNDKINATVFGLGLVFPL